MLRFKVTVYLWMCLVSKQCNAAGLNCRYLNQRSKSCDHFGRHGEWKRYLWLKFWRKSPIGDHQIKRETDLKIINNRISLINRTSGRITCLSLFASCRSETQLCKSTVQVRDKRPTHMQNARTLFAYTRVEKRVQTRAFARIWCACFLLLFTLLTLHSMALFCTTKNKTEGNSY